MSTTDSALRPAFRSIGEAMGGHRNALGFIRLVLAAAVIFDHAFPLGGFGTDPFWALSRQQASLGSIAVAGFFVISGYLIAKSGMSADVLQFLWRRVLRIFPAYWAVLLFTALVVAPVVWLTMGRPLDQYFGFGPNSPVYYFTANWTLKIGTYGIYDIFARTTPYGLSVHGSVFNGSIWTLYYEFACYLLIAILVAFGVMIRARVVVPIMTAAVFAIQLAFWVDSSAVARVIPFFGDQYMLNLMFTFLLGSCIAVYSKSIPFDDRLGVLAGIVMLLSLRWGGFAVLGLPTGAYFVLYLGARLGGPLRRVGQKNDYSYGVYVYGFLVEQVLAYMGVYRWGYVPYALIALVVTLGFAWLSWHGVEKHAMALKDLGPGRGWRHWRDRLRGALAARRARPAVAVDPTTARMSEE